MTYVALLAFAAFAASVITTLVSLARLVDVLSRRSRQLDGLVPAVIVGGTAKLRVTSVAHALEGGKVEVSVVRVEPEIEDLELDAAEARRTRIWTDQRAPFALGSARRSTRAHTIDLGGSPQLFAAPGSETILATYDPRPSSARDLLLARSVLLLVLASAAASTVLLFSHPMESPLAKLGGLIAVAHFLLVPLLERAVRIAARDPAQPGARFIQEAG